jgi:hypothetical protein
MAIAEDVDVPTTPPDPLMDAVAMRLAAGEFRKVVFFCGSVVSRGWPTLCPKAPELLQVVMRRFWDASAGKNTPTELRRFLRGISPNGSFELPQEAHQKEIDSDEALQSPNEAQLILQQNFFRLPFEQFMGCLHNAKREAALGVVDAAFGRKHHGRSNANHEAIAQIANTLLQRGLCDEVSLLTTNYDVGFEKAFAKLSCPLSGSEQLIAPHVPTSRSDRFNLHFAKLHGDIDHENSMVFTFDRITETTMDRRYFGKVSKIIAACDLLLFVGYGLNDLDLRPVIHDGLKASRCLAIWNERPETGKKDEVIERRGMTVARDRLLRQGGILVYRSDLSGQGGNGSESLLFTLARALRLETPEVAFFDPLPDAMRKDMKAALSTMRDDEVALFMGNLASACCSGEAAGLLGPYARDESRNRLTRKHAELYLHSSGHTASYQEGLARVRELARKRRDPIIRANALGYGGLLRTLAVGRGGGLGIRIFADSVRVIWDFLGARLLPLVRFRRLPKRDRLRLTHFRVHFWSRAVSFLAAYLRSSIVPLRFLGCLLEWVLGSFLMWRYLFLTRAARRVADLRALADCLSLYSQSALLARRIRRAAKVAQQTLEIFTQMQVLNEIALAERSLAWVCLGYGTPSKILEARQRLGRAAGLGAASADTSLLAKFVANLLRVSAYEAQIGPAHLQKTAMGRDGSKKVSVEEIIGIGDALRKETDVDWTTEQSRRYLETLACFLNQHKDAKRFWATLIRFSDVKQFPILLVQ